MRNRRSERPVLMGGTVGGYGGYGPVSYVPPTEGGTYAPKGRRTYPPPPTGCLKGVRGWGSGEAERTFLALPRGATTKGEL